VRPGGIAGADEIPLVIYASPGQTRRRRGRPRQPRRRRRRRRRRQLPRPQLPAPPTTAAPSGTAAGPAGPRAPRACRSPRRRTQPGRKSSGGGKRRRQGRGTRGRHLGGTTETPAMMSQRKGDAPTCLGSCRGEGTGAPSSPASGPAYITWFRLFCRTLCLAAPHASGAAALRARPALSYAQHHRLDTDLLARPFFFAQLMNARDALISAPNHGPSSAGLCLPAHTLPLPRDPGTTTGRSRPGAPPASGGRGSTQMTRQNTQRSPSQNMEVRLAHRGLNLCPPC
jgi:hypothetical protein